MDHQNSENTITSKFRTNLRDMRNRFKDRVRVASCSYGSFKYGHMPALNGATALRATATGLVVARVFKGNVILSRLVHGKAKQKWANKMAKFKTYFPSLRALLPAWAVSPAAAGLMESNVTVALRRYDRGPEFTASKANSGQELLNSEDSSMVRMLQAVAVPLLGNVCHAFMNGLNYTEVYGAEKLLEAIRYRPKGQPLITVSNHVASVDDPFVISSVLPPQLLIDAKNLRWTLCATDRCFTNAVTSLFFRCVKVLPVARGDGLYQKGMNMALSKLNQGDWVHIFPEGSRSRDGGKTIGPVKSGVGRLVIDAEKMPLVVPFVHTGMEEVMPIGSKFPHVKKKVTVIIGDPIKVDDLFMVSGEQGFSKVQLYDAISLRVGERLQELKTELDELVYQQSFQNGNTHNIQRSETVNHIFHFDDWEAHDYLSHETLIGDREYVSNLYPESLAKYESHGSAHLNLDTNSVHQQGDSIKDSLSEAYIHANDIGLRDGIFSRVEGFRDPCALMGFAVRGLLMNYKRKLQQSTTFHDWRQAVPMNLG